MLANYAKGVSKQVKIGRKTMTNYLTRAAVDKRIDERIQESEAQRIEELTAIVAAVDANWLYTLHTDKRTRFGKKRLRYAWEAMIRNRIAFREFYRDEHGGYKEQPTGKNVEDEATVKALLDIGVDIRAWERELIHYDRESGEVSFEGEGKNEQGI